MINRLKEFIYLHPMNRVKWTGCILFCILIICAMTNTLFAQSITITGPERNAMVEGEGYTITWSSDGIESVNLIAYGERTPLGRKSRGWFREVIAESIPAYDAGAGWTVPWIDSDKFYIKVKGYDAYGNMVAEAVRGYTFRPAVLANRTADGLYLDLHLRKNQRLYVQKDYQIIKAYVSSSSENYLWMPPDTHPSKPHDHAGVFKVINKSINHHSVLFDVDMPFAMQYHGGHFIHATSRNLYKNLGEPASHGCNRLTREDARELFDMTPVGTRVEVIGPDG